MNEIILLKLGEMVLKGLNRRSFEDKLQANLHRRLRPFGQFRVYTRQSATYVEPIGEGCDVEGAYEALKHVFGIVGLSLARPCGKDKDAILACAKEFLDDQLRAARTFKVETKRADKTFPMTSIQLSQYVGGELHEAYDNLEVDVHHPELTVYVEVRDYAAYVHTQPQPGAGGLPVGINGRAVSLLSGGIDSPVASWMIAKRGVALDMVHFFSYPYTSLEAKEKVLELARLLTPWTGRLTVHVVPFTAIQEELRRSCPEELFTVIMRRFMMRIAQEVARRCGAKALVTGECLGQVASQTMDAMLVTGEAGHPGADPSRGGQHRAGPGLRDRRRDMAQINVILWDVDGTLLDFSAAERRALEDCFRSFQMGPCTPELLARYSQINRTYWRRLERGELTKPQVLLGRFEEFFAQEWLNCRDIPAFNQEYQLRLGDTVVFRDDAGSLVARLKGRVRQYAVTNGTRVAQERKLSRSGLDRMLDGVFISEIVGTEKPGAAFFDAVFSQIGPCCRDEVMIVGDSLTSDMQGGRSAGILCCWYNPLGEPRPADPRIDYDIRDLRQVEQILDRAGAAEAPAP